MVLNNFIDFFLEIDFRKRNSFTDILLLTFWSFVYFFVAKFGMTFIPLSPSNITLLWLPSGIAFALIMHFGMKAGLWVFVASFLANLEGMIDGNPQSGFLHTAISAVVDVCAGLG